MRSACLAMDVMAWTVIVPLRMATLVTSLAQSLGTSWGIMRDYWVIAKIVLTVSAGAILLLHMQPISDLADVVAAGTLVSGAEHRLRVQLIANAGAALLVLVVTTVLQIYKPRGLTPYGQRAMRRESAER